MQPTQLRLDRPRTAPVRGPLSLSCHSRGRLETAWWVSRWSPRRASDERGTTASPVDCYGLVVSYSRSENAFLTHADSMEFY